VSDEGGLRRRPCVRDPLHFVGLHVNRHVDRSPTVRRCRRFVLDHRDCRRTWSGVIKRRKDRTPRACRPPPPRDQSVRSRADRAGVPLSGPSRASRVTPRGVHDQVDQLLGRHSAARCGHRESNSVNWRNSPEHRAAVISLCGGPSTSVAPIHRPSPSVASPEPLTLRLDGSRRSAPSFTKQFVDRETSLSSKDANEWRRSSVRARPFQSPATVLMAMLPVFSFTVDSNDRHSQYRITRSPSLDVVQRFRLGCRLGFSARRTSLGLRVVIASGRQDHVA